MMGDRDVNVLRAGIESWHEQVKLTAPSLHRWIIGTSIDCPCILDSIADSRESAQEFLRDFLGRDVTDLEIFEWEALVSGSGLAATLKRRRTLRALDDPRWIRKPAAPSLDEQLIESGRQGEGGPKASSSTDGKWPAPGLHRKETDPAAEQAARNKFLRRAVEIVAGTHLPFAGMMADGTPESIILRLAGGRRLSTIRKYVHAMETWILWSWSTYNVTFPKNWIQVAHYMGDRAAEPCGPSTLKLIIKTLDFFEELGGIRDADKLARGNALVNVLRDLVVDIKRGTPTRVTKAPQQTLAVIVSFEFLVGDASKPAYIRLYAWTKLIRHWGALRWSDLLNAPPHLARLSADGLTLVLTQTKTTGPGKKVEILTVYISGEAWIAVRNWLSTGWHIFQELGKAVGLGERKHWLPLPDKTLECFSRHPPKYSEALAMTRKALSLLQAHRAVYRDGTWKFELMRDSAGSPEPLFESQAQIFWREHGDRATLINWSLVCGIGRDVRAMIGRWSPSTSDEYLRVQKFATMQAQETIASRIRSGTQVRLLGEPDLWEQFHQWASETLSEGCDPTRQVSKFQVVFPGQSLELPPGEREEQEDDGLEKRGDLDTLVVFPPPHGDKIEFDPVEDVAGDPGTADLAEGTFVVSTTSRGKRRSLHRIGRCWRKPGLHYRFFHVLDEAETLEAINKDRYDRICLDCYPKVKGSSSVQGAGSELGEAPLDEETDAESYSSSCSSSATDVSL